MVTVLAALIYAWMGWPAEAERWADVVDGWQDRDRAHDPAVAGWAALLRAFMCRRGVGQMRADADEAARRFAAQGIVTAGPALLHGVAGILSGDLDEGDAFLEDAVSTGENTGAHEVLAAALAERSLLAMASAWNRSLPGYHLGARTVILDLHEISGAEGIDPLLTTTLTTTVRWPFVGRLPPETNLAPTTMTS